MKKECSVPCAEVFKEHEEMAWVSADDHQESVELVRDKHEISARLTSLPSHEGFTWCSKLGVA